MKIRLDIESGDMGQRTGVAHTTILGPNHVSILFDPRRMADTSKTRDLIVAQLDVALTMLALADGQVGAEHLASAVTVLRLAEEQGFTAEMAKKETDA